MTGERTALSSAQREPPYGLYTGARALAFNTRLSCSPTVCRAAQGAQAHARLGSSHGRSSSDAGRGSWHLVALSSRSRGASPHAMVRPRSDTTWSAMELPTCRWWRGEARRYACGSAYSSCASPPLPPFPHPGAQVGEGRGAALHLAAARRERVRRGRMRRAVRAPGRRG